MGFMVLKKNPDSFASKTKDALIHVLDINRKSMIWCENEYLLLQLLVLHATNYLVDTAAYV